MRSLLDVPKVVQAIAVILENEERRRGDMMRVLKLLYEAQRESLRERYIPIFLDTVKAMSKGPVFYHIYRLMKDQEGRHPFWSQHIRSRKIWIELTSDPGRSELSTYEIRKLKECCDRHTFHTGDDLSTLSHAFPEWQKCRDAKTASCQNPKISYADTLEALKITGRKKDVIVSEIEAHCAFLRA